MSSVANPVLPTLEDQERMNRFHCSAVSRADPNLAAAGQRLELVLDSLAPGGHAAVPGTDRACTCPGMVKLPAAKARASSARCARMVRTPTVSDESRCSTIRPPSGSSSDR
jgi:hypothetical protein